MGHVTFRQYETLSIWKVKKKSFHVSWNGTAVSQIFLVPSVKRKIEAGFFINQ